MIWRRNWRFSKYGNFSAPAGKFPFGVRRRNLWRKDTGVPGGTVPFRYGEAKGIFSFEKRMSPQPPKEKRGGISISPRTPLKRHKGAKLRFLPFGNPSKDKGSGSGKGGRGCPLCDPTNAMPANAGTHSGHLGTFSAAGRRLLIFVGSSYRPLLRMGELTQMCQLIPDIFSFPPCTAHFLFDVSKRKWGVRPCGGSPRPFAEQRECKKHSNGQSPFGSSIPHGITMLPRAA